MADLQEVFRTLEDATTGEGLAATRIQSGDAPSTKNGILAFAFRDSSGNVVLPQLNASGQLPVTSGTAGTCLRAHGELAAGSDTIVTVTGAVISLTASTTYSRIGWSASCLQSSLFQLIWNNNGSETVLDEIIVGPGQFTFGIELSCLEFTAGGTGTQELLVKAKNFDPNKNSSLRATVTCLEL